MTCRAQARIGPWHTCFSFLIVVLLFTCSARAQDSVFQLDPQHTSVNFTLGDVLHTVHGSFHLKRGSVRLDPATGKLSGEIAVDAKSGESGNGMRDRKMHREVLESDRFPEIVFRPDRIEGNVLPQGKSAVQVHGIFAIHGTEHEMTVPAEIEMFPDRWGSSFHFSIPYAKWGMKNPSTFFLRVSDTVDIEVAAAGSVEQH